MPGRGPDDPDSPSLGPLDHAPRILGALFGVLALAVQRDPTERAAMRLFSYSITYVTLLFAAMIVDVLA